MLRSMSFVPGELPLRDPTVMRALANPTRLRILDHLRERDRATASGAGSVVGLSSSACSYHLNLLARCGLVQVVAGAAGDQRETWWEPASRGLRMTAEALDEAPEVTQELRLAMLHENFDTSRQCLEALPTLAREWQLEAGYHYARVLLTAEELANLRAGFDALIEPFLERHLKDRPADSRPVVITAGGVPDPHSGQL